MGERHGESLERPRPRLWLIDDDRDLVQRVARGLRPRTLALECFAAARNAVAALDAGSGFDVALIDADERRADGASSIRELSRRSPRAAIVVFTERADDSAIFAALRAGAQGYLTKDVSFEELASAVDAAARGGAPFSLGVSRRLVAHFREPASAPPSSIETLTVREREVLSVLCRGASYREAAIALGIATGTVQTHVKRIYDKLGVSGKVEATRMVLELERSERLWSYRDGDRDTDEAPGPGGHSRGAKATGPPW